MEKFFTTLYRSFRKQGKTSNPLARWLLTFCTMLLGVMPSKAATITIGTGTSSTSYYPVYTCWDYSYVQNIYMASELTAAGMSSAGYISSIQYYCSYFPGGASTWNNWDIYMGNTSKSSFTSTSASQWVPVSSMSKVFSGSVSVSGSGWFTINFTTPFYWDGTSNIVIAIDENAPSYYCTANFAYSSSSFSNRSMIRYRSTDVDPTSLPTGNRRDSYVPNVKFDYTVATACSGAPTGGTALASSTSLCPGKPLTLYLSGSTLATGLTYVWDTSSTGTGGWGALTGTISTIGGSYTYTPPAGKTTYYRCRVTCGASTGTSTTVAVSVSSMITPPYTETFEGVASMGDKPACSDATSWASYQYFYTFNTPYYTGYANLDNHTAGGSKWLFAGYALTVGTGIADYWFTPGIQLTAGKTYEFSYWYMTDGYPWSSYEFATGPFIGNSQTRAAMTTAIGPVIYPNNTTYAQYLSKFTVPTTGTYYIGLYVSSNYGYGMALDDISLVELPPCSGTPTAGAAFATPSMICTTGPTKLDLSGYSSVSGLTFEWESSATGTGGWTSMGSATTTPVLTTGTLTSTTYYRCKVSCTSPGGSSAYSTTVKVDVGPVTPPYLETFEAVAPGANALCAGSTGWSSGYMWYSKSSPYSTGYNTLDNHTTGGSRWLYAGWGLTYYTGSDDYWFTPGVNLTAGKTYEFNYWYLPDGAPSSVPIMTRGFVGTSQDAWSMTPIGPLVTASGSSYKEYSTIFTPTSSGTYYFGIFVTSNGWYGMAIDDIGVKQLPPCSGKPTTGTPTATPTLICSTGSTTLGLTGTSKVADLSFDWQSSSSASGPWSSMSGPVVSSTYTTPTLTSATYFRCKVTCTVTGDTTYSAPILVNVGAIIPPYYETFESVTPGDNADCAGATNWGSGWAFNTSGSPYTTGYTTLDNHTPGGSNWLFAGYALTVGTGMTDYWFTPAIHMDAGATYEFSYWYLTDGYPWSSYPFYTGAFIGTDQADWAMTTAIGPTITASASTYKQYLARYTPTSTGDYYIGIYVSSNYGYGMAIDDIGLEQLPPCDAAPVAGTAWSDPTLICSSGTAKLDLKGTSRASYLSFEWESSSATTGPWTSASGVLPDAVFTTGTLTSTTYFRCKVTCTLTGDVSYSSVVRVPVGALVPPYHEDFELVTPGSNAPCAGATNWGSGWAWYTYSGSYGGGAPSLDNHTPGGSNWLWGGYYLSLGGSRDFWFTPALQLTGGKLYQFTYWYVTDGYVYAGYPFEFGAYMGNAQTEAAMTTAIGPVVVPGSPTAYKKYVTKFTPSTSGVYYIGIYAKSNYYYGISIDDIDLQEVPPCSAVATIEAGTIVADPARVCNVGGTTSLELDGSTLATGLSYTWLSSTSATGPFTPTGGTSMPYTTTLGGDTWFKCVVSCPATGAADTTDAFLIEAGAYDLPYAEDFESVAVGAKPICTDATYWDSYSGFYTHSNSSISSWYPSQLRNNTPGGNRFLMGGYYLGMTGLGNDFWFSPGLNMKSGYKYDLSYYYVTDGYTTWTLGNYLGKSQSAAAMTIPLGTMNPSNTSYTQYTQTFTVPASDVYYLGIQVTGNWWYALAIDDININYSPCDAMPTAGGIIGTVASGTALCPGATLTLQDTGATYSLVPGIEYQWQRRPFGSSSSFVDVDGATSDVYTADTLIGYEYRFKVTCTYVSMTAYSGIYKLPELPPHPPVNISAGSSLNFCLGDTVHLAATSFSGATYDWMLDGKSVSGWKFSDMGATEPGVYKVKVTSPASPCPAYSNELKLEAIDPGFKVEVTTPLDSILCAGEAITLSATSTKGGVSYSWRKDNVDIPGATAPSYTVTTTGYYRVAASDGSSLCPAISRNILFTVKPNPPAYISVPGGTYTACDNIGVLLEANTGGYTYQWYRNGSPVFGWVDSSALAKNTGIYTVKVRTADGCESLSPGVTVNILPAPNPIITLTGLVLGTLNPHYTYQWYRNGVLIPGATTDKLNLLFNGRYTVVVTDVNGCSAESLPFDVMLPGLGVDNVITANDVKLYPNPTETKIFIEAPASVNVEVKDVTGRVVYEKEGAKEIDMSKYADGVYLFSISNKDGVLIKKEKVNKVSR